LADPRDLVRRLESRPATLGGARLIAIDGPAGSGKTTLAHDLADRLRVAGKSVQVLRLDDLYDGWSGLEPSLARRVASQVLEPLAAGRSARWQAYDWEAGEFREWHDLAPVDVLVLEGCGAGALDLAPYITLLVWLETAPDIAAQRMAARDGIAVLDHLAGWRRSELTHFAANRTRERADVVIAT
jgi:uridine kinase